MPNMTYSPTTLAQVLINQQKELGESNSLAACRKALSVALGVSNILQSRVAQLETLSSDRSASGFASATCSGSPRSFQLSPRFNTFSPELLLLICHFLCIRDKARTRESSQWAHRSLMGCPIDLTESRSVGNLATVLFVKQNMAPLSLVTRRVVSIGCGCAAGRALRSINLGSKIVLTHLAPSIRISPSSPAALKPGFERLIDTNLAPLASVGFDRPWLVTGLPLLEESSAVELPKLLRVMGADTSERISCIQLGSKAGGILSSLADCAHLLTGLQKIEYRHEELDGYDPLLLFEHVDDYPLLGNIDCFKKPQDSDSELGYLETGSRPFIQYNIPLQLPLPQDDVFLGKSLRHLILCGTNVGGSLASLRNLKLLEVLDLSATDVSGRLRDLESLTMLRQLSLSFTRVQGQLREVASLLQLSFLRLEDCKNVDGDISKLSSLTKLEFLGLAATPVTGKREDLLALLPNLISTTLEGTAVVISSEEEKSSESELREDLLGLSNVFGETDRNGDVNSFDQTDAASEPSSESSSPQTEQTTMLQEFSSSFQFGESVNPGSAVGSTLQDGSGGGGFIEPNEDSLMADDTDRAELDVHIISSGNKRFCEASTSTAALATSEQRSALSEDAFEFLDGLGADITKNEDGAEHALQVTSTSMYELFGMDNDDEDEEVEEEDADGDAIL